MIGFRMWLGVRLSEISFATRLGRFLRLTLLARFWRTHIAPIPRAALVTLISATSLRLLLGTGIPLVTTLTARAITDLAQSAAKRFDLPLVCQLLTFRQLHQFQNFLHLIHGPFQRFDDLHDFIDRLVDR